MKKALICIATGERYRGYAANMFRSADRHWPEADRILFTDASIESELVKLATHTIPTVLKGFPIETLMRYHTFLTAESLLKEYDQVFWCDADMLWVAPPGNIYSDGITATLHPGYIGQVGTPERRPQSRAYMPMHLNNKYFCGGFNGGNTEVFLGMANVIRSQINIDEGNGILAIWNDESHLNRYLYENPPAKILTPSYCYPEGCGGNYGSGWPEPHPPILVALTKKVQ